jgi:hypothetical protein
MEGTTVIGSIKKKPLARQSRVKGIEGVLLNKHEETARDHCHYIYERRKSFDRRYSTKYPGPVSKRAYSKLSLNEKKYCETYKRLFSNCSHSLQVREVLVRLNKEAGLSGGESGFWVYPTDYVPKEKTLDIEKDENKDFELTAKDKIRKSFSSNQPPTDHTLLPFRSPQKRKSLFTQSTHALESHSESFSLQLSQKDNQISELSEELKKVAETCKALQDTNRQLTESNLELGKRVETIENERQLEKKAINCEIARHKIYYELEIKRITEKQSRKRK